MNGFKQPVIVAFDGFLHESQLYDALMKVVGGPIAPFLSHLKFNDALHMESSSSQGIIAYCLKICAANGIFPKVMLDVKISDTHGTVWNTLRHYSDLKEDVVDIVTIRENCSIEAYVKLRKLLPNAKITLVSALTDMPEDECIRRNGMHSKIKILKDLYSIQHEYELFRKSDKWSDYADALDGCKYVIDAVVCSPLEVDFLRKNMHADMQFITPGIRDAWMAKGQQSRSNGVCFALNQGADFVVMGSQVSKGNPKLDISPEESQRLTVIEIEKSHSIQIVPGNPMKTLENCEGYYHCPVDKDGNLLGPLVGYAGKDPETNKNYVGAVYINCAMMEWRPVLRQYFAKLLVEKIIASGIKVDAVLGAPLGATAMAFAVGDSLMVPTLTPEKKVTKLANDAMGLKEESEMILERHPLRKGSRVLIIEDLSNNFSTTAKLKFLIEDRESEMVGIACVVNRSKENEWAIFPVVPVIHKDTPQYKQEDPEVAALIEEGSVILKPKHNWSKLQKVANEESLISKFSEIDTLVTKKTKK